MKLTERRKADRLKMAELVEALCSQMGASCQRFERDREVRLAIQMGEAVVGVEFDGDSRFNGNLDNYCMPWNVDHRSNARFTDAFGRAVNASVNPYHRRKCMGFAPGIENLLERLRAALECIKNGEAFAVEEA